MPVGGKALASKLKLECIGELPPAGYRCKATGSEGAALSHALVCCTCLLFSSTDGNTTSSPALTTLVTPCKWRHGWVHSVQKHHSGSSWTYLCWAEGCIPPAGEAAGRFSSTPCNFGTPPCKGTRHWEESQHQQFGKPRHPSPFAGAGLSLPGGPQGRHGSGLAGQLACTGL